MTTVPQTAARRRAQELTVHLDEAAAVCSELCDLAAVKRRALIGGDLASLLDAVQREQDALTRLLEVERRGRDALGALGAALGVPEAATLGQVEGLLPAAAAGLLQQARSRVLRLMSQVRAENRHNAELLGQAMAFVDFCLGVLLPGSRTATYGASGDRSRGAARAAGLVDRAV